MPIKKIYDAIPPDVKVGLAKEALKRVGNLIVDEDNEVKGLFQSVIDNVEPETIDKAVDVSLQLAEVGLHLVSGSIAMGVQAAGNLAVIAHQIEEIKDRLEQVGHQLNKINVKVDIGYYAKFKAAIELIGHAFSMKNEENKASLTHQAVQTFLETANIYTEYIEQELENNGRMLSEYLLIVILSYIGQVKCCLELEETQTAQKILNESTLKLKKLIAQYTRLLLSNNPAIYLHNDFSDLDIDLKRLTRVYNWLGVDTDENQLFKSMRENYVKVHIDQEDAISKLPPIIWNPVLDMVSEEEKSYLQKLNPLNLLQNEDVGPLLKNRLKASFESIEKVIEAYDRFASIKYEVDLLIKENMTYKAWKQKLSDSYTSDSNLLYVALKEPVEA